MIKTLNLLLIMIFIAACDQNPGYVAKANFKAEEFAVKPTISQAQFQKLKQKVKEETVKGKNTIFQVVQAKNLKDEDFHGLTATMLKISKMPQLTNQAFSKMALQYMIIEDIPEMDEKGISKVKGLKSVQLWNMPHMTNEKARVLLKKRIKIYDDRNKTHQKFRTE